MTYLQETNDRLMVAVYVQPKASKTCLAGFHDNALKVSVAAPALEGRANDAVTAFFAKLLHLPKSAVTIASGLKGRRKRMAITGVSAAAFKAMIGSEGCGPQSHSKG